MMYRIHGMPGEKYRCTCKVQDGTETWVNNSFKMAVSEVINFAKFMNGTDITEKDIAITNYSDPAAVQKQILEAKTKLETDLKAEADANKMNAMKAEWLSANSATPLRFKHIQED